jgi:hypothetical protein
MSSFNQISTDQQDVDEASGQIFPVKTTCTVFLHLYLLYDSTKRIYGLTLLVSPVDMAELSYSETII